MLKMLKSQNPDKEYPSNIGLKWFEDEETILLEELKKNTDIEIIAQNHNRTIGGINSRRKEIAYKMYLKNISIEEIIEKTKLDEECIKQTIDKRKNYNSNKITETKKPISLETEIAEIKNDIKELKNTIKEMIEMMKAVYEFEDT
jgi:hypothetical protein